MQFHKSNPRARRMAFASSCIAALGIVVSAGPAQAVSNDAVRACGAYDVKPGVGASVPYPTQTGKFSEVRTNKGTFKIICGNGSPDTGSGAVHIEVKHLVPNWADALNCITKVINKNKPTRIGTTTKYQYYESIPGSRTFTVIKVITGTDGIVTAYPEGSNEEAKWRECSQYA